MIFWPLDKKAPQFRGVLFVGRRSSGLAVYITESNAHRFNYEFLHKTFSEFLTADFLLRVAKKQFDRVLNQNLQTIAEKETFTFCFGYNWLYKHENVVKFLFEYGQEVIPVDSHEWKFILNSVIKSDLRDLFEKGHQAYPSHKIRLLDAKPIIEHLAIYSQNIILLWLSLCPDNMEMTFHVFDSEAETKKTELDYNFNSQDRDETDINVSQWKRIARLWSLVGNNIATAKISTWITILERNDTIILFRNKNVTTVGHNFSYSASVSCNSFELLLSYYDMNLQITEYDIVLLRIESIISKKKEFVSLAIDVILHRFEDLYVLYGNNVVMYLLTLNLSKAQQVSFVRKMSSFSNTLDPKSTIEIAACFSKHSEFIYKDNPLASLEYIRILLKLAPYFPTSQLYNPENLNYLLSNIPRQLDDIMREKPLALIEYIKLLLELNSINPFRKRFRRDFLNGTIKLLTKEAYNVVRGDVYSTYEYLKLLNDLKNIYQDDLSFEKDFYNVKLVLLMNDIEVSITNNPHITLEYLKLVHSLESRMVIDDSQKQSIFKIVVSFVNNQSDYIFGENSMNLMLYLSILLDYSKGKDLFQFVPKMIVFGFFHRISNEFMYFVKESPENGIKYLSIIKKLHYSHPEDRDRVLKLLKDLFKSLDSEFKVRLFSQKLELMYLEFILFIRLEYYNNTDYNLDDKLLECFNERHYHISTTFKGIALMIKYNVPTYLITKVLEKYPKIHSMYFNSPEAAKDFINAITEYDTHENIY